MKTFKFCSYSLLTLLMMSCGKKQLKVEVYETSESGNKLTRLTEFASDEKGSIIKLLPNEEFQTITGFGGAFTESSAYLLNELIPKVAHEKGLKTIVGAWIGHDKVQNEKEIEALINLAKQGHVDIAVVGNEVLLRNELTEQEVLDYISRVKRALTNIPIGYVDAYYQFHERPRLVEACDIILANCYPFWEGCNIDQASIYLKQMHAVAKKAANDKPVIITETGWPNKGDSINGAEPSDNKAMKYFINANNWSQQEKIEMFYFSSFDESWKVHHEGDVGQRWGIWDKNEKVKYINK